MLSVVFSVHLARSVFIYNLLSVPNLFLFFWLRLPWLWIPFAYVSKIPVFGTRAQAGFLYFICKSRYMALRYLQKNKHNLVKKVTWVNWGLSWFGMRVRHKTHRCSSAWVSVGIRAPMGLLAWLDEDLELFVSQLVDRHDLLELLGIPCMVLQEVWDAHVLHHSQALQALHILIRHLQNVINNNILILIHVEKQSKPLRCLTWPSQAQWEAGSRSSLCAWGSSRCRPDKLGPC